MYFTFTRTSGFAFLSSILPFISRFIAQPTWESLIQVLTVWPLIRCVARICTQPYLVWLTIVGTHTAWLASYIWQTQPILMVTNRTVITHIVVEWFPAKTAVRATCQSTTDFVGGCINHLSVMPDDKQVVVIGCVCKVPSFTKPCLHYKVPVDGQVQEFDLSFKFSFQPWTLFVLISEQLVGFIFV